MPNLFNLISPDRKNKNQNSNEKVVHLSVIGLSGIQKGRKGVGKSCLCARFMSEAQDDYKKNDYRSEISLGEFTGPAIKQEHFLYWGEKDITLNSRVVPEDNNAESEKNINNSINHSHNESANISITDLTNNSNNLNSTFEDLNPDSSFQLDQDHSVNINSNKEKLHLRPTRTTKVKCRMVEQTIFLEDGTNTPFTSKAQKQQYYERATSIKLIGNNRIKYTCNEMLDMQYERALNNSKEIPNIFNKDGINNSSPTSQSSQDDPKKHMPTSYKVDSFILVIDASDCVDFLNNFTKNPNFYSQNHSQSQIHMDYNIHSSRHDTQNYDRITDLPVRHPCSQFSFLDEICPILEKKNKPIIVCFTNMDKVIYGYDTYKNLPGHDSGKYINMENDYNHFKEAIRCKILGIEYHPSNVKKKISASNLQNGQGHSDSNLSNHSGGSHQNHNNHHHSQSHQNSMTSTIKNVRNLLPKSNKHDQKAEQEFQPKYHYQFPPEFVETSSELNVNIEKCFQLACSKVLKKPITEVHSYKKSSETVNEIRNNCLKNYKNLIENKITDYKVYSIFKNFEKEIEHMAEYKNMVKIYGSNSHYLTKEFRDRIQELMLTYKAKKQSSYMYYFPQALYELLPDLSQVLQFDNENRQWSETRDRLYKMAHFKDWFIVLDGTKSSSGGSNNSRSRGLHHQASSGSRSNNDSITNKNWFEHPHMNLIEDRRIPHELLKSGEAAELFHKHKSNLQRKDRKSQLEKKFREWYHKETAKVGSNPTVSSVSSVITPGMPWEKLQQYIPADEIFYKNKGIAEYYKTFLEDQITQIKKEFSELLKENVQYAKKRYVDFQKQIQSDERSLKFTQMNENDERERMITEFSEKIKGDANIEEVENWYGSKGLPAVLLEDLKQCLKVIERKNEEESQLKKSRDSLQGLILESNEGLNWCLGGFWVFYYHFFFVFLYINFLAFFFNFLIFRHEFYEKNFW